ncbi:hypothetical protein AGMMS49975_28420 [Clostridia bacterium]|nr:hypothetical protein AGMMS49975_28420 [Clostridia bacterium]
MHLSISERLFRELYNKNVNQKQFATDLELSYSTVKKWRTNNSNPSVELIAPIAEYLGVSVYWLLTGNSNDYFAGQTKNPPNANEQPLKLSEQEQELIKELRTLGENEQSALFILVKAIRH